MCYQSNNSQSKIYLKRCAHGTYHLTIGNATHHLSASEIHSITRLMYQTMHHYAGEIEVELDQERWSKIMRERLGDN